MSKRLFYVVDPMCSWCYGFKDALDSVLPEIAPDVEVSLVMGGLAADSNEPMDEQTKGYVQDAWRAVGTQTGAEFNHEFWSKCAPRRSTYPSCRAVIVAAEIGMQWEMLAAIQRAYYREARNPSDNGTLIELAGELGIDMGIFAERLASDEVEAALAAHFALRKQLGASSFP
ncbi:MAG: putative protein-disulfide isomerase, partial [Planctomycetota bacterium]